MNKKVRTRFAPSPTGEIHVGGLRTALYAYLWAKKNDGQFLLRIEDTDKEREVEGAIEGIVESLKWAGISSDEGVMYDENGKIIQKGEFGPYIQSERLEIYQRYVLKLLASGDAYHCFCSSERLTELRKKQQKNGQPSMYDGKCCSLSKDEVKKKISDGNDFVIRLKVPKNDKVEFFDKVYGKISFETSTIDDQVLIKSDGFPTYHFAVVVDDHLMEISHVIRGEEWLPSTPKHILLYKALGWDLPTFVHVPGVLGENHKKLSKREGDVSVADFRAKGYLSEGLVNFLVLLGWNPKSEDEIFSLKDLVGKFDLSGLHKAGAVFDCKKLDWMNSYYIKKLKVEKLVELCQSHFDNYLKERKISADKDLFERIVTVEKERMRKISDITDNIDFYFSLARYDSKMLAWKEMTNKEVNKSLEKSLEILRDMKEKEFVCENLKEKLFEAAGDDRGALLWPLRVALTGQERSPSPFEVAWVIGKEESLRRVKRAIGLVS